ncbi:MAG: 30S ribosomal protein S8 [Candidatus Omnitrophica bacterium]|nr:30S ribosomal protein S8 [Candidatus Omnitrophota bacterium]
MTMTDPIADMLTRIRNKINTFQKEVEIPFSKIKEKIAKILKEQGYIKDYNLLSKNKHKSLRLQLIYLKNEKSRISTLKRASRPGLRFYAKRGKIPRIAARKGIVILSTSLGVMTDSEAREKGVGGEVLCYIW